MAKLASLTLAARLTELILREGAITFHDWMKAALYDPSEGYYNRPDLKRWGREGDYRTSPERSELFAPTFARYFASLYDELHRPSDWTIVEGGAADGRLAVGVLRALESEFPLVFRATTYFLDEVSSDGCQRAKQSVVEFGDRVRVGSLEDLSQINPGIYFSNELLDSFPVHRLIATNGDLLELYVTLAPNGKFVWATGPMSTPRLSEFCCDYSIEPVAGQIIEVNLEINDWLMKVAAKLADGYLITIDYGAESRELYDSSRRQGTLRAFSRHAFVEDVLAQPGEYDITASVNWTQVKLVGERWGLKVVDFAHQDRFLLRAGLLEELGHRLTSAAGEPEKLSLSTSAREMILPGGMASSFQVLVQKRS